MEVTPVMRRNPLRPTNRCGEANKPELMIPSLSKMKEDPMGEVVRVYEVAEAAARQNHHIAAGRLNNITFNITFWPTHITPPKRWCRAVFGSSRG